MAQVLLVDDDADVLEVLQEFLQIGGHEVTTANSGNAALDLLDTDKPLDLLLTDVVMPGLHGFNLARMAVRRRPKLRVLYLSGFSEAAAVLRDEGPRLGKLLAKPIRSSELLKEVDEVIAA